MRWHFWILKYFDLQKSDKIREFQGTRRKASTVGFSVDLIMQAPGPGGVVWGTGVGDLRCRGQFGFTHLGLGLAAVARRPPMGSMRPLTH